MTLFITVIDIIMDPASTKQNMKGDPNAKRILEANRDVFDKIDRGNTINNNNNRPLNTTSDNYRGRPDNTQSRNLHFACSIPTKLTCAEIFSSFAKTARIEQLLERQVRARNYLLFVELAA